MTVDHLKTCSLKDLAEMARKRGVHGWHDMRKDQLVKALVRSSSSRSAAKRSAVKAKPASARATTTPRASAAKARTAKPVRRAAARPTAKLTKKPTAAPSRLAGHLKPKASSHKANGHAKPAISHKVEAAKTNGHIKANGHAKATAAALAKHDPNRKPPGIARMLGRAKEKMERSKNLAYNGGSTGGYTRDRLVVMVRDPFWLHAYWELTRAGVQRAEAALGQDWHMAKPVLRLVEISNQGTTSSSETVIRNISIHGGVNNWYVDVQDPPKTYRMDIGYLASTGKFYLLARSNLVSTPRAGASDTIDENWTDVAEQFEKIYAMSGGYSAEGQSTELQELFEERLRRPMGSSISTSVGFPNGKKKKDFNFTLDAELIVYGSTEPTARVNLQGDPVQLRPDGTFTVRFALPDSRQIIPAVAQSADGLEQRTIVLAVERNTKAMEPVVRDNDDQ